MSTNIHNFLASWRELVFKRVINLPSDLANFNNTIKGSLASSNVQDAIDELTDRVGATEDITLPPVQNLTNLKAIDTTSIPDKSLILVEDSGLYRFNSTAVDPEDTPKIIDPTTGPGKWIQISSPVTEHNRLHEIQGGASTERYHLTLNEWNVLRGNVKSVISSTPPLSNISGDGDIWIRSSDHKTFIFDLSNDRWIFIGFSSYSAGRNSNSFSDSYFRRSTVPTNTSPILLPYNSLLFRIDLSVNNSTAAWDLEIRKNIPDPSPVSIPISSGSFRQSFIRNDLFNSNDEISIFANTASGQNINRPTAVLFFKEVIAGI